MSNTSLPDPYGRITTHTITGQQFFYRWPELPYLDNAKECIEVVTYSDMRQYAAAVSAAKDAEIAQLRQYLDTAQRRAAALGDEVAGLRNQLHLAEVVRASQVEGLNQGAAGWRERASQLEAEVAGLRELLANIIEKRCKYGWGFETDAAIDAALAARKGEA